MTSNADISARQFDKAIRETRRQLQDTAARIERLKRWIQVFEELAAMPNGFRRPNQTM